MKLDEAIVHAREVATEQKRRSGTCVTNDNECDKFSNCIKCAEEHEKLAEWLEELKEYRMALVCSNMQLYYEQGYNKAIDDFENEMIKRFFICKAREREEVNYIAGRLKESCEMEKQEAVRIIKEYRGLFTSANNEDKSLDEAIKALEENRKYHAIGTVEECRAAVEKQKERKPIKYDKMALWDYACPKCGEPLIKTNYEYKYCDMCGQKLDWGDEE